MLLLYKYYLHCFHYTRVNYIVSTTNTYVIYIVITTQMLLNIVITTHIIIVYIVTTHILFTLLLLRTYCLHCYYTLIIYIVIFASLCNYYTLFRFKYMIIIFNLDFKKNYKIPVEYANRKSRLNQFIPRD